MTFKKLIDKDRPTEERNCSEHGAYTATNFLGEHWTACPKCLEILQEKQEEEILQKEKEAALEREQLKWKAKINGAAIPERFKDRTLDSYIARTTGQKKALAFSKEYAENFDQVMKEGRSAIFVGKPGTGKTHLAIGIALEIIKQQRSPVFVTVQRLIRRVKDSWHTKNETESEVVDVFASPDLLILDEVGVQFGSEFEKQMLFDVLNERYEKLKPSILLSNIPREQLSDYLGERVTDRLRENGGKMIGFDWDSYRRN
tara:strand:+ start:1235 stop:2008 length:774 start_codon:yes stop_codon:yes gene_type:complete